MTRSRVPGQNAAREARFAGGSLYRAGLLVLALASGCAVHEEEAEAGGAEPPMAGPADPGMIDEQTRLGLQVLRARAFEESLAERARLSVPSGPRTLGETVPLRLEIFNALGQSIELFPAEQGLTLALAVRLERSFPEGDSDELLLQSVARLEGPVDLVPGQAYTEFVDIPLESGGDTSSLWVVTVGARLRFDGVRFGEQVLPANGLVLQEARFLAFPPGWEALQPDPLGSLRRAASLPQVEADRHVLISAALLTPEQRSSGIQVLVEALADPPSLRRTRTITTALRWLSGLDLGDSPPAWTAWWEEQRPAQPPSRLR